MTTITTARSLGTSINHILLSYVLGELQRGNFNRCRSLGLHDDELSLFKGLSQNQMAMLASSPIVWANFNIDTTTLRRLVEQVKRDETQSEFIDRVIRMGASSPMLEECFGLSYSETAARRRMLGVEQSKGRPKELTQTDREKIWKLWVRLSGIKKPEQHAKPCALTLLAHAVEIADSLSLGLTPLWAEIQSYWQEEHNELAEA